MRRRFWNATYNVLTIIDDLCCHGGSLPQWAWPLCHWVEIAWQRRIK